jgi:lipopolysaccharide transport system ATP-binding protein
MATAIEFNHVGKQYRLGLVSTGTISHDLNRWWQTAVLRKEDPYLKIGSVNDRTQKADSDYVWALRDIDFKVEQGDVVGIIGKNGAGKSTLLKLLSKVTGPTVGSIRARGRIASLLEVGTGFHQEMTGRENIYMNGAILGMTKAEIAAKLDEIVDFSGCERYLDTPVKRYSSGMMVRLGFAVAAHLDPEILVVDEVLAVGDAEFQKKAIGKMQDVSRGEGRTVLFVSHNMESVRRLCKSGMLLENGKVKLMGTSQECVDAYLQDNLSVINLDVANRTDRVGNQKVRITGVSFISQKTNEKLEYIPAGEDIIIKLKYFSEIDDPDAIITLDFCDAKETPISYLNNKITGDVISIHKGEGEISCNIKKLPYNKGEFRFSCALMDSQRSYYDDITNACIVHVADGDFYESKLLPYDYFPCLLDGRFCHL